MTSLRDARRWSFNTHVDAYRGGRPPYPTRVYDILAERCGLRPGARVLEIGPGTGDATVTLLDRGAHVVAVEPGAALAAVMRERCPTVDIIAGEVECVDLPSGRYDLAIAATALHWVDTDVALPRVASALRPVGWLATWWTEYGDPEHHTPFRIELMDLYRRHLPDEVRDLHETPQAMRTGDWTDRLTRGGQFGPVTVEIMRWTHRLTGDGARRLFGTFPNVNELPPPQRTRFLDGIADIIDARFGGAVDDPYVTVLYTTQRLPDGDNLGGGAQ